MEPSQKKKEKTKTKYDGRANLTNAGKGRPKGVLNKTTSTVKQAILAAFEEAGGAKYLVKVSKEDPKAFLALLGKIVPTEIAADISGELNIRGIEVTFVGTDKSKS